ncbi:MAG: hypothetical protein ACE149_01565 [Armatimonadota bacterium]
MGAQVTKGVTTDEVTCRTEAGGPTAAVVEPRRRENAGVVGSERS